VEKYIKLSGEMLNVQLKKLHDLQYTESFMKEAMIIGSVRPHPNVIQFLGKCSSPPCIVMELMIEGSLWDNIKQNKLSVDSDIVNNFSKQIASGITHLHSEGIIHCDISARNILIHNLGNKYTLKISDFSLARKETNLSQIDTNQIPVRWASPEVLSQKLFSKASDTWAFAVTVWELAEFTIPFFGLSNEEVVAKVCAGDHLEMPTRIQLTDQIITLLKSCWQMEPSKRPTMSELVIKFTEMEPKPITQTHVWKPTGIPKGKYTRNVKEVQEEVYNE